MNDLLISSVQDSLQSRGLVADVTVALPFVKISRKVSFREGLVEEVSSMFRFDGDLVVLRGLGRAAFALECKINQVAHMGGVAL